MDNGRVVVRNQSLLCVSESRPEIQVSNLPPLSAQPGMSSMLIHVRNSNVS